MLKQLLLVVLVDQSGEKSIQIILFTRSNVTLKNTTVKILQNKYL